MAGFHEYHIQLPNSTHSPKIGGGPHAKFVQRLALKWSEILLLIYSVTFVFNQTYTMTMSNSLCIGLQDRQSDTEMFIMPTVKKVNKCLSSKFSTMPPAIVCANICALIRGCKLGNQFGNIESPQHHHLPQAYTPSPFKNIWGTHKYVLQFAPTPQSKLSCHCK